MKPIAKLVIILLAPVLLFTTRAFGQSSPQLTCLLDQISAANHSLEINCTVANLPSGRVAMRFVDAFAGVDRLSERLHSLKVTGAQGATLPLEIRGGGVYLFRADAPARPVNIRYEMRLARAFDPAQFALVSGIGAQTAVLILADLLPYFCVGEESCAPSHLAATVKIAPPAGWRIATTEPGRGDGYDVPDLSHAVFFLGRLREQTAKIGQMNLRIALGGEWNFRDQEMFSLAEAIARDQQQMLGGMEHGEFLVTLAPFPQPLTGLRSSAVTLGHTVVLLLNPNNDDRQTFKHYQRHLAHEMFHFYLPNAFRIREHFDWFWEGFTRYVALMTLARLRVVNLREYLDAITAEYGAYRFNPSRTQLSLLAASTEKFASAASYELVYRKGMLVAALYDLELRWQSRGKNNLADVMKSLYQNCAMTGRETGNREILQEMNRWGSFARLISDEIEGVKEIDLVGAVKAYGLIPDNSAFPRNQLRLIPARKLTERQRQVLTPLATEAGPLEDRIH